MVVTPGFLIGLFVLDILVVRLNLGVVVADGNWSTVGWPAATLAIGVGRVLGPGAAGQPAGGPVGPVPAGQPGPRRVRRCGSCLPMSCPMRPPRS